MCNGKKRKGRGGKREKIKDERKEIDGGREKRREEKTKIWKENKKRKKIIAKPEREREREKKRKREEKETQATHAWMYADSERILQRPHTAYTIFKSAYKYITYVYINIYTYIMYII